MLIHVAQRIIIMTIHAPKRDEIVAFSCQKAVLHHQFLTHAESLLSGKYLLSLSLHLTGPAYFRLFKSELCKTFSILQQIQYTIHLKRYRGGKRWRLGCVPKIMKGSGSKRAPRICYCICNNPTRCKVFGYRISYNNASLRKISVMSRKMES